MFKYKKIIIISIIMCMLISITSSVFSATITLDQIVSKFNSCRTVSEYATYGVTMNAVKENNKIILTASGVGATSKVEFILNDNILSTNVATTGFGDLANTIIATTLIDCIGQLNGYDDGECFDTLNSDEIKNYTLANEGLEIKDLENNSVEIKIDITKKFPLLDMSSAFIEVSDLQDLKEYISGDGSAQKSKGNLVFWKGGYGDEVTIFIGEKESLTENSYNSILSVLEVMFDGKDVVNYFKSSYSSLSQGDKEFAGFKVEINPTKNGMETTVLGTTYNEFVRITIDKDKAVNPNITTNNNNNSNNTNINTNANTSDINTVENNTTATTILPEAGITVLPLSFAIVAVTGLIGYIRYKNLNKIV